MAHLSALLLAVIHTLAACGWLGAMGYSLLVVQPRAAAFFGEQPDGDEQLEQFISRLARRQRWPVLTALAAIAITGVLLVCVDRPHPAPAVWVAAVAVQSLCLMAALALFSHVSWHLWPMRIFALPAERPRWRRRFRRVGLTLLALAVTATIAGVVTSMARRF